MEFCPLEISGVVLVKPKVHGDARGFFAEIYREKEFSEAGIDVAFVQDNQSRSSKGVLRGLHFQPDQAKLVRVSRGTIFDVVVDLRKESLTYKQWVETELSDENMWELYVPIGFAHGFVVLSDVADVCYRVGPGYYNPATEKGIRWNDPDVNVEWPVTDPSVSERDNSAPTLAEMESEITF